MARKQHLRGVLDLGEQIGVARKIGDAEHHLSSLPGAKQLAGTAQLQVPFGDAKPVIGLAQDAETFARLR